MNIKELEKKVLQIRLKLIEMFSYGKAHHFGGSLSCVEIMTSLYFHKMNYSAKMMNNPVRDRFIMSKGHSVPTQYVILAMLGIIPIDELKTIKRLGTRLQGHPDMRKTPGIEACTGSLGQGLSFANGIALAARMDNLKFNIYVLLGDGELQEGQIWEAAMTTSHYNLNNICVIIDRNRYQSQGEIDQMMSIEPLKDKWDSFGWHTKVVDGHDIAKICKTLDLMNANRSKPLAIIAETIKGKGVSFFENTHKGHNATLTKEQYSEIRSKIQKSLTMVEKWL